MTEINPAADVAPDHPDEARQEASQDQAELKKSLEEANDRALRLHAELDNVRKRARRELEEERRFANLHLLRDLLPVVDNLARAVEAGETTRDVEKLLEGVKLVAQQLDEVLARYHCRRISTLGQPFDPNLHEAIAQQPSQEYSEPTVLNEARAGFTLHDRVIRPSQVVVSAPPESPSS